MTIRTSCAEPISTHAPLAGSDEAIQAVYDKMGLISTHAPLAGSDDLYDLNDLNLLTISTHAPLAGSDSLPRFIIPIANAFQPTLPSRGATDEPCAHDDVENISTHAPLAGSDIDNEDDQADAYINFNPRSPRGERLPVLRLSPLGA